LPRTLATVTFSQKVATTKEILQHRDYWLQQFKGVNDDHERPIPATVGWKIKLNTFGYQQGGGEGNSYCVGLGPESSSENGITFKAHVGRIRNSRYPSGAPGYVNCRVFYDEYQLERSIIDGSSKQDVLSWRSDLPFPLDNNHESFSLVVRTFDGDSRDIGSTKSEPFYDVIKEINRVVIRPKIPTNL
jgi:hypothetical protein